MGEYSKYLKRKLNFSRGIGLLSSIFAVALLVLNFLKLIDPWFAIIDVCYFIGMIFTSNVTCQDIKVGSPWPKVNAIFSVVFYMLAIGLLIFAFMTGELAF